MKKINNKFIEEKKPCFIIAEAGVNHNGSLKMAKRLIGVAKEAGVDAIKFQTFKTEGVMTRTVAMADYQKKNIGKKETQFEMIKKLELKFKDFISLKKYCDRKKIIFLSTPHSEEAIDFLEPLIPIYKISSGDLTNLPFLKKIAGKKKPIILSTGMAILEEIEEAVKAVLSINKNLTLLHCTTNYPTPLNEVNLRAMLTLKKEFGLPVGYSDHTEGLLIPVMAIALGARVIEKHFTLDKKLPGPDHKTSLNPKELREMVTAVRSAEQALGSSVKKPTEVEKRNKKVARKSIVAKIDIPKGVKITKQMLTIKRPGTGIKPKHLEKIIGKIAKKDFKEDDLIKFKNLK